MEEKIKELKEQLTGNMMADMEIRQKIHELEMQLKNITPESCSIDCENCGS